MTIEEKVKLEGRLEAYDSLIGQVYFADDIIDAIDGRIDLINKNGISGIVEVTIGTGGYVRRFGFTKQEAETLKEFLDSYRCDVRKRLEEL